MSDTHGGQPAGWYPDPGMADTVRYWDGAAWTEHRAPIGQVSPPAADAPVGPAAAGDAPQKKPDPFTRGCGLGCLGVVLIVVIIAIIGAIGGGGDDPPGGGEFGARDVCQQFVKDRLKSPSTADFSDTTSTANSDGSWTVSGAVDSQNGFGAMIRNTYTCTVEPTGGDNWHLDNLDFSGN